MQVPAQKPIDRVGDDPRWGRLRDYLFDRMVDMGLGLWFLSLSKNVPSSQKDWENMHISAEVNLTGQSLMLDISFGDMFFVSGPEFQRHVVIHELLHVLEKPADKLIDNLLCCGSISQAAGDIWCSGYNQTREQFIDTVAALLAPRFPLPELEKE